MKKQLILIMLLVMQSALVFIPYPVSAATTYYVAKNGNDGNPGTEAQPWLTINHAATTIVAGDTVYVKNGTYNERLYMLGTAAEGTEAEPITYFAYPGETVILNYSTNNNWEGQWHWTRQEWIRISGFTFHNATECAIRFVAISGDIHNITIDNCTFYNTSDSAIWIAGSGTEGITDVVIENCTTNYTCNSWYATAGAETFSLPNVTRATVMFNDMRLGYKQNIDLKSGASDSVVRDNFIDTTHPSTVTFGGGIYVDSYSDTCDNISIYRNRIWGNKSCITIGAEEGGRTSNISIYNNILNSTGNGIFIDRKAGQPVSSRIENISIYHNTFYDNVECIDHEQWSNRTHAIDIRNNIFDNAGHSEAIQLYEDNSNYSLTIANNLYNTSSSDVWGLPSYNGTPAFVDERSDYNLSSNSRAIDNGTNMSILRDMWDNSRPQGIGYDIGAVESSFAYSGEWSYYSALTINSAYITTNLINYPVLVQINSTVAAKCQADGGDLRFYNVGNTTEYDYEIERWNPSGTSYVWARIPYIYSAINTRFIIHYGNLGCANGWDQGGTWDANYTAVYHMNSSSTRIYDSTDNHRHSNYTGGNPTYQQTGRVGYAIDFDGTGDYFNLPDAVFNPTLFSVEMFAYGDEWRAEPGYNTLISFFEDGKYMIRYEDYVGATPRVGIQWDTGSWSSQKLWDNPKEDVWRFYGTSWNDVHRGYYNNSRVFSLPKNGSLQDGNRYQSIGHQPDQNLRDFNGLIDEVRISNTQRNSSWMNATYHMATNTTITWGSEGVFNTVGAVDNFYSNTTGLTSIDLEWVIGDESTHTRIQRSTTSYPGNRNTGTNVYNDTGVSYSDSSLSSYTTYYYRAFSYNSTTHYWSGSYSSTHNETGPSNPTVGTVISGTAYMNVSWTAGTNANTTVVVRKATSYPTSVSDGSILYNGTLTYHNDTTHHSGFYTLFSYNKPTILHSSGVDVEWGSLTIRVYDENTSLAISNWDVFVTNENGSTVYDHLGNNNPLFIDIVNLPTGDKVAIKLNATDYDFRIYYMNITVNNHYTLNGYLAPENITELYLIEVVGPQGEFTSPPVEDVRIQIMRYINATDEYQNVSIVYTDANGQAPVYLIPGELYKVRLTKTDYTTEIADLIPREIVYADDWKYTYRIIPTSDEPPASSYDLFYDDVDFTGTMYTNGTIRISYDDSNLSTTNTTIYLFQVYNEVNVLNHTDTRTGDDQFAYYVSGINTSRSYQAKLYFNNTANYGDVSSPITITIYPINGSLVARTRFDLEARIESLVGPGPLGSGSWCPIIAIFPGLIVLMSFGPGNVASGIAGSGLITALMGAIFATVVTNIFPVLLVAGVGLIIGIAFIYYIAKNHGGNL